MDLERVEDLSRFMDEKGLVELELELEEKGFKVKIKKRGARPVIEKEYPSGETPPAEFPEESIQVAPSAEFITVTSPLVGIFHRRPEEKAPSYVKIGDQVKTGDILGYIQAMGIKNEIRSPIKGIVIEALVDDNHPVDYGRQLFFIKPKQS